MSLTVTHVHCIDYTNTCNTCTDTFKNNILLLVSVMVMLVGRSVGLLPPKLQRRGLVFKTEVGYYGAYMMGYYGCVLRVTMEHVWLVTMKQT